MTPTQDYLDRNPGVLAEMIAAFQQQKRMAETAKSKDPVDANVVDNPNLRAFEAYPKMLYNHARRTILRVENAADHEVAATQGWQDKPWHGPVDPGVPTGPANTSSGMDEERMESMENRMLSIEQMMGDMSATLGEIVKRLPKDKQQKQRDDDSHRLGNTQG